jgi:hypothetical protein
MPPKPTYEQRVEWHREHARDCGCRKPPADIAARLAARAMPQPGPRSPDRRPAPRRRGSKADPRRIVCAVDDAAAAGAAAQLAVELAGPGVTLDFLSVSDGRGFAAARSASLGRASARRALDDACWMARRHGVRSQAELRHHHDAAATIRAAAGDYDLLALGASGPLVEAVWTVPVLFARAVPAGCEFPRDMLIATDATPASREVVAVAGALARRHDVVPCSCTSGARGVPPGTSSPSRRRCCWRRPAWSP